MAGSIPVEGLQQKPVPKGWDTMKEKTLEQMDAEQKQTFEEADERVQALAKFLGENDVSTIEEVSWDGKRCSYGHSEYLVLTDSEADYEAVETIKQSLWAFRPSFLSSETGLDESIFKALSYKCEGANDAVESLIKATCGIHAFIDTAISADGRGCFLAQYDSEENVEGEFFIYRVY